jgi:hypothetical protein
MLVMGVLVTALPLSTPCGGAAAAEPFNIEKAVTGATTPADHEAIATYYDREATTAKAKAAENRRLAETYRTLSVSSRVQVPPMENHYRQLAQHYTNRAAENAARAAAHRQMAQEATPKKP